MTTNKTKLIFSLKLAEFLVAQGHQVHAVVPNLKDKRKKVWVFDDTPQLNQHMTEYISSKK